MKFSSLTALVIILFATLCAGCVFARYGSAPRDTRYTSVYHSVKTRETLGTIASAYRVSQNQIALLNGIRDPESINVGQQLFIGYDLKSKGGFPRPGNQVVSRGLKPDTESRDGGVHLGGALWWPVKGGTLVSRYGPRWGAFHDGIDIAAPSGTPVYAAHSGIVKYSGNGISGYGSMILLKGDDGLTTVYAHNRRLLVSEGDQIKGGQKIAEVGATGRATGPHLHFEVRRKSKAGQLAAVDPLPYVTMAVASNADRSKNQVARR